MRGNGGILGRNGYWEWKDGSIIRYWTNQEIKGETLSIIANKEISWSTNRWQSLYWGNNWRLMSKNKFR